MSDKKVMVWVVYIKSSEIEFVQAFLDKQMAIDYCSKFGKFGRMTGLEIIV